MRKAVLIALLLVSCAKPSEKPDPTSPPPAPAAGDPVAMEKANLLKIIDFAPGDTIKLDSPKRFIQVFILFTIMQHEEAVRISKELASDEEIASTLEQSRLKFYSDLGISEEDYAEYGKRNADKIAVFLEENPDFQKAYDFIQEQGTEF